MTFTLITITALYRYVASHCRPVQVYAVPLKKSKSSVVANVQVKAVQEEMSEEKQQQQQQQQQLSSGNNLQKTFRENFLGICPNLDEEVEEESVLDEEEEDLHSNNIDDGGAASPEQVLDFEWDDLMQQEGVSMTPQDRVAEKLR